MKRGKTRIYHRDTGDARRYYGDFRDYADVGGGREALVARGERLATTDLDIAQGLVAQRITQLDAARRGRALHGIERAATLAAFSREHLIAKAKAGKVTDQWMEGEELRLRRALDYFGDVDLSAITTARVRGFAEKLTDSGLSGGTVRQHLNTLSNLYKRARAEQVVPPGTNPVGDLSDKPTARRMEARWLEVHDAALLLEAARTYRPKRADLAVPYALPLLATCLLTGGRESEVTGLEVGDVSFDRKTVTFRPNEWRRLKTLTSHRVVPLWPQLEAILRTYVFGAGAPPGRLLFPGYRTGQEAMLTDFRKLLDVVAERAGWKPGEIRSKMFRHTYCAARLQTLDRGAPVSEFTVGRELGHGGATLVRRVYGHLGQVRQRGDAVEYRVEQHTEQLGERLVALQG